MKEFIQEDILANESLDRDTKIASLILLSFVSDVYAKKSYLSIYNFVSEYFNVELNNFEEMMNELIEERDLHEVFEEDSTRYKICMELIEFYEAAWEFSKTIDI